MLVNESITFKGHSCENVMYEIAMQIELEIHEINNYVDH